MTYATEDKLYQLETRFGYMVANERGIELLERPETDEMLEGLVSRGIFLAQKQEEFDEIHQRRIQGEEIEFPPLDYSETNLRPHVNLKHKYLGGGSEGEVFRFNYHTEPIAVKFQSCLYVDRLREVSAMKQFYALEDAPKHPGIITPKPYLATEFCLVMDDMSSNKDFFEFVKENPKEKNRLLRHIERISTKAPFEIDTGDIFCHPSVNPSLHGFDELEDPDEIEIAQEIMQDCPRSSIFIVDYDSSQRSNRKRYTLGVVDIK